MLILIAGVILILFLFYLLARLFVRSKVFRIILVGVIAFLIYHYWFS